jgi:hypothetical protein
MKQMITRASAMAVLAKMKAYLTYPTSKYILDRAIEIVHIPIAIKRTRLLVSWFL